MSNEDVKKKAKMLEEKFIEALEVAEKIEKDNREVPDAIYYVALAFLVGHHKNDPIFEQAVAFVEAVESENKRLTTN